MFFSECFFRRVYVSLVLIGANVLVSYFLIVGLRTGPSFLLSRLGVQQFIICKSPLNQYGEVFDANMCQTTP